VLIHRDNFNGIIIITIIYKWGAGIAQWYNTGVLVSVGAGNTTMSSANIKNAWNYTSTPLIRLHGMVLS